MGRVGFIQDKLEIKFLILYVAARLIEPVPFEAMQELTMCDDGIDFFDFSECLSNLVESQHLTLSDDGLYAITEKGLHNGAICESSLPYSVRLRADKNITIFNQKLKRRAQIQSDIAPRRNGTYTVTLAFNDDESQPILKMELMVPKEVMAKDLAERFQKKSRAALHRRFEHALLRTRRGIITYIMKRDSRSAVSFLLQSSLFSSCVSCSSSSTGMP